MTSARSGAGSYGRSGLVAGAASAIGFTVIHDVFISDIWEMLVVMVAAGAMCGFGLAVTFRRLSTPPSLTTWLWYNLAFTAMLGLLGLLSVFVFEPVTTVAAIMAAGGPIDHLVVRALPMTLIFTVAASGLMTLLFGRRWSDLGPVSATVAVLVLLLGLNVSTVGLVDFGGGSAYLVGTLFALIAALAVVFAGFFAALERKSLLGRTPTDRPARPHGPARDDHNAVATARGGVPPTVV